MLGCVVLEGWAVVVVMMSVEEEDGCEVWAAECCLWRSWCSSEMLAPLRNLEELAGCLCEVCRMLVSELGAWSLGGGEGVLWRCFFLVEGFVVGCGEREELLRG